MSGRVCVRKNNKNKSRLGAVNKCSHDSDSREIARDVEINLENFGELPQRLIFSSCEDED